MTVDFICLKLYVVKVILKRRTGREEPAMMTAKISASQVRRGSYYSFTKVRYAGRYERGLGDCPAETGARR